MAKSAARRCLRDESVSDEHHSLPNAAAIGRHVRFLGGGHRKIARLPDPITRKLLPLHGSELHVESTMGQGSTFCAAPQAARPPSAIVDPTELTALAGARAGGGGRSRQRAPALALPAEVGRPAQSGHDGGRSGRAGLRAQLPSLMTTRPRGPCARGPSPTCTRCPSWRSPPRAAPTCRSACERRASLTSCPSPSPPRVGRRHRPPPPPARGPAA